MCGIAGVVGAGDGDLRAVVEAQLATLEHRGPDARGVFASGPGAIGQNRLAIIDLVTGDPPITNEDETIAVALNGEIYNFQKLRDGLERDGHEFSSRGDTEVIAHLAETHAPVDLCRRLDGMFAFAVWDGRRQRVILGRDRVGKKPLYYWCAGGNLVFGSEIKALFAATQVPRRLDADALPAYLAFGYVPTPRTFFDGVRSLPPGHVLTFEPGGEPVVERYWRAPVAGLDGITRLALPMKAAAAGVRESLEAAVERRLISDVPLGAFLSGGIDSSAVVGIMASKLDRPVKTFTIGFEDTEGFDERPYARLIAQRHGTEHHEFVVQPDAVDLVERLVWHHDQPFGDSSAIPTFLLSELTRGHVTVALSGDGGDEAFAGYERFAAGLAARRYAKLPDPVRGALQGAIGKVPAGAFGGRGARLQRFAGVAAQGLPDAYRRWISFVQDPERRALTANGNGGWAQADYRAIWESSAGAHPLDRLLDLNLRTYLLDDLLVKTDRTSMAHGLEVRCPFLDTSLLEYATRLPPSMKARGLGLKRVLKAAVADLLPREIMHRPKRGFGVPLDRWFRQDLRGYTSGTLGAPDARVRAHLSGAGVDSILAEHASGARDHGHALWTLLTLEVFLRREGW
ncbi:MAG: asparagine synthase (glutamine-hydrolyzing) [Actinomycetota bacterium]|nr:asparagine synthase (glutamine-hydrolyzing) [Actinomycetota bacterium]